MRPIFDEIVKFKAPLGFGDAVSAAARREHTTVAEFLRRAAYDRMADYGVSIESKPISRSAESAS